MTSRSKALHFFLVLSYCPRELRFSVPQLVGAAAGSADTAQDQIRAISSIPAYIRESTCFAVLCPSLSSLGPGIQAIRLTVGVSPAVSLWG